MEPEGSLELVLTQINPVHTLPFRSFKIHFNIILRVGR
jgi:hypothetical protein